MLRIVFFKYGEKKSITSCCESVRLDLSLKVPSVLDQERKLEGEKKGTRLISLLWELFVDLKVLHSF